MAANVFFNEFQLLSSMMVYLIALLNGMAKEKGVYQLIYKIHYLLQNKKMLYAKIHTGQLIRFLNELIGTH